MEEGDEVDAGRVKKAGIHSFQAEGVMRSEVVVFDLDHRLSGLVV